MPALPTLPAILVLAAQLPPGLTPADLSRILSVLAQQAGAPGRVACRDIDITMQLENDGISTDPRSPVAWASDAGQARAYAEARKFVVCGQESLLASGGCLAITRRNGKVELVLHLANSKASGVQLSDSLLKAARKVG